MQKVNDFVSLCLVALERGALTKLVFSRPRASEERRVVGRLVSHKERRLLALEYSLPGDTVRHKNVGEGDWENALSELSGAYLQANLITAVGECEFKVSKSGKEALLGADKLKRKLLGEPIEIKLPLGELDNKKSYILSGGEDFLIALGVSDKTGRVHDKRQGKFRQINRFLEHIEDIYPRLKAEGELLIYDLCCGKSYLSFAVYYYLKVVKGREVSLIGIDLKRDVISWCESTARGLGYSGMRFIYDDIKNVPSDRRPDMVISLHACDVATDIVLNRAAELGAGVILSTPCCHRYLNDRVRAKELGFVTRFPQLKNKLCEALTDAIRLARLEAFGYKVSALELTDPDDTPKNTLLRAIYVGGDTEGKRRDYETILDFVLGEGKLDYLKGF